MKTLDILRSLKGEVGMQKVSEDYNERYDYLVTLLNKDDFIERKYVGAEIPNYICSFPPEQLSLYNEMAKKLTKKITTLGRRIIHINLYEVMIELVKETGNFEDYLEESELTQDEIKDDFMGILDNEKVFAPRIAQMIVEANPEVVIIDGVGEVYPFIRIHALLEMLPSCMRNRVPLVIFYPGKYDKILGSSALQLFGKLEHKNYYRAFNIFTEVK